MPYFWEYCRWEVEAFRRWRNETSRRLSKASSLLLGVFMFMFGFLKFFQPFRGCFVIQIQRRHLPQGTILAGKPGEMVTGCLFLLP